MIPEVTDPFKFNKCCLNEATTELSLTTDYYNLVRPFMNSILEEIYRRELYGKDTEQLYNAGNDFHYLYVLLMMIHEERKSDAEFDALYNSGCGQDKGVKFYLEKYNMDCIQKHFYCIGSGYDIGDALSLFGMNPDFVEQDGIGFMYIDYNVSDKCEFSLKPFQVK